MHPIGHEFASCKLARLIVGFLTLNPSSPMTGGVRNISNLLTIGTEIDAMSSGLKEYAQSKGWWHPADGDFSFCKTFVEREWCVLCPGRQGFLKPRSILLKCSKALLYIAVTCCCIIIDWSICFEL